MKLRLRYILPLAVATAALFWISQQSGHVSLEFGGYILEMSPLILAVTLWLFMTLLLWLDRVRGWAKHLPSRRRQNLRNKRDTKGIRALVDGFSSLAAGDTQQANHLIAEATKLLHESQQPVQPLLHMLHAQIASQEGDSPTAITHYEAMLDNKESRFLGLRGLLMHHRRNIRAVSDASGTQIQQAIDLAEQALTEKPSALWVGQLLAEWYSKTNAWDAYHAMVRNITKHKSLSKAEAQHWHAIGYAAEATNTKEPKLRSSLAQKALHQEPSLLPAHLLHIDGLQKQSNDKALVKALTKAWAMQPHPFMLRMLRQILQGQAPEKQLKSTEKLTSSQPKHLLTHLAVAQAAMACDQWSKARNHLKLAWTEYPSHPVIKLFITLEEKDPERAGKENTDLTLWKERLEDSTPLPNWHCQSCGNETRKWYVLCPSCGEHDRLYWPDITRSKALST